MSSGCFIRRSGFYLIGVDERLAQGQLHGNVAFRRLQMHRDEGAGHRRVAGQEKRLTLFQNPGELIADGICSQIRPIVADSDDDLTGSAVCTCRSNELLDKSNTYTGN